MAQPALSECCRAETGGGGKRGPPEAPRPRGSAGSVITAAGVVAGASFWLVAAEAAGDVGTQTGACGAFPDPGPPSWGWRMSSVYSPSPRSPRFQRKTAPTPIWHLRRRPCDRQVDGGDSEGVGRQPQTRRAVCQAPGGRVRCDLTQPYSYTTHPRPPWAIGDRKAHFIHSLYLRANIYLAITGACC